MTTNTGSFVSYDTRPGKEMGSFYSSRWVHMGQHNTSSLLLK